MTLKEDYADIAKALNKVKKIFQLSGNVKIENKIFFIEFFSF